MLSKSETFKSLTFRKGTYNFDIEKDYTKIKVINGKSINLPDKLFTNYLSHNGGDKDKKQVLKEINKQIQKNAFDYNKFDRRELTDNKETTDRVLAIINSYKTVSVKSITQVYKLRHNKDKTIQLYLCFCDNEAQIVLFDVYHLGLPADNHGIKFNPKSVYNAHKNKLFCISNIIR